MEVHFFLRHISRSARPREQVQHHETLGALSTCCGEEKSKEEKRRQWAGPLVHRGLASHLGFANV